MLGLATARHHELVFFPSTYVYIMAGDSRAQPSKPTKLCVCATRYILRRLNYDQSLAAEAIQRINAELKNQ